MSEAMTGEKKRALILWHVTILRDTHLLTWREKSQSYWLLGLLEEVWELAWSLMGLHRHQPEQEITQIAAICMNWMEHRWQKNL